MKIDKYFHMYGKGKEIAFEEVPKMQKPKIGRWIYDDDVLSYEGHFGAYTCSCCNKTFLDDLCMNNGSDEINVGNEFAYCPFCGAKMGSEVSE